jgi:carbon storage regulator
MLVLDRKIGEKVIIGDKIIVTVVGMNGRAARLGFEAPEEIAIVRKETLPPSTSLQSA